MSRRRARTGAWSCAAEPGGCANRDSGLARPGSISAYASWRIPPTSPCRRRSRSWPSARWGWAPSSLSPCSASSGSGRSSTEERPPGPQAASAYTGTSHMLGIFNRLIDSNEREVKRLGRFVEEINALEPEFEALSDEDIRARMATLRAAIVEEAAPEEPGEDELDAEDQERRWELARERRKRDLEALREALDERIPEVFAATREMSRRRLGMRHFDVQLMGGVVLHEGRIAEMKTGEGKTLIAPLAAALNGLSGRGVHVITVNDYLAKRDAQ